MELKDFFIRKLAKHYGIPESKITEEFLEKKRQETLADLWHQVLYGTSGCGGASFLKHLDKNDLERLEQENNEFARMLG